MDTAVPPLPAGGLLLHIGMPKTGSTSLQLAAQLGRQELRSQGVLYPGNTRNQSRAIMPMIREGSRGPRWRALLRELEGSSPDLRALISCEDIGEADDDVADDLLAAFGPQSHVVVTVRALGQRLPSEWQQRVRNGTERRPFSEWLTAVADSEAELSPAMRRQLDQGGIVERWVRLTGPERITVVVIDPAEPELLYSSFDGLLALPAGTLASLASRLRPDGSNRSMSRFEMDLVERVSRRAHELGVDFESHVAVLHRGGFLRAQARRRPQEGEPAITLPPHAQEWILRRQEHDIAMIRSSGARILGDLSRLAGPVRVGDQPPAQKHVPLDLVAEMALGIALAALEREDENRAAPD